MFDIVFHCIISFSLSATVFISFSFIVPILKIKECVSSPLAHILGVPDASLSEMSEALNLLSKVIFTPNVEPEISGSDNWILEMGFKSFRSFIAFFSSFSMRYS